MVSKVSLNKNKKKRNLKPNRWIEWTKLLLQKLLEVKQNVKTEMNLSSPSKQDVDKKNKINSFANTPKQRQKYLMLRLKSIQISDYWNTYRKYYITHRKVDLKNLISKTYVKNQKMLC